VLNTVRYVKQIFTQNGTVNGIVTVASTYMFVRGATVFLSSSTQPIIELQIFEVVSPTKISVKIAGGFSYDLFDCSQYLVADSATITQPADPTKTDNTEEVVQPVSIAYIPLPDGAATEATLASVDTTLDSINTKTPALVSGRVPVDGSGVTQPISVASLPLPSGAATETTLSSINTKTPSLGQALMANSQPVVVASNQSDLPTKEIVSTSAAVTTVAASTSSTQILATNPARLLAIVHNESNAVLYLKLGAAASSTSYSYRIPANATWEMTLQRYTGEITGSWSNVNGSARVTELT
jgi:hypothetical protein